MSRASTVRVRGRQASRTASRLPAPSASQQLARQRSKARRLLIGALPAARRSDRCGMDRPHRRWWSRPASATDRPLPRPSTRQGASPAWRLQASAACCRVLAW